MTNESTISREKLASELKAMISNTEELLKATAGQAGDKIESLRARAEETLSSVKSRAKDLENSAVEDVKLAAKATDKYVHSNPWVSIGIAAGIGVFIGWLVGRK